ncbi:hypothetical protein AO268_12430 [Pseudomonas sp. ICMP 8385]|uniref:DUF1302 domain-containing protein n=1 Tax=Pseudomonas sp. ICMP 8385 TaxID=1718920 RepID=UPI000C07F64F|nr:DUF1302 domain-containing protein [Pseudomonas sp. ICMP 8385]PHN61452.1 hypothetical protein AO268_12430 [Pseudomonas sp. ICMP 8385]
MRTENNNRRQIGMAAPLLFILPLYAPFVDAFPFKLKDSDINGYFDNTLKYSSAFRVSDKDRSLIAEPNADDGNRNFDKGLISNRVDLFSELGLSYQNLGFRVSGATWYDEAYNQSNDNDSPVTVNHNGQYDEFSSDTRKIAGRKGELLDAFVYGSTDIDGHRASFRLGKHTLLWGQSLFFPTNGIAYGQAPIDVVKALSVPNTRAAELFRPINQLSAQFQFSDTVSMAAFYQLDWEKTRLPPVGSYFSVSDVIGEGNEKIIVGQSPFIGDAQGNIALYRGKSREASKSGQFGLSLTMRPGDGNTEYGFYALRFNNRLPQIYAYQGRGFLQQPGQVGEFTEVYSEGVKMFGASFSSSVGEANFAGELSTRYDMPLRKNTPVFVALDDNDRSRHAEGRTLHAQLSTIYLVPRTPIWESATFVGELAWHRLLSVTRNKEQFDSEDFTNSAIGMRFVLEPSYYQAAPGLDLFVPVGMGYTHGKSPIDPAFNNYNADGGGDLSIGLRGVYENKWNGLINYSHFYGSASTKNNAYRDRDFISISIQRAF